MSDTIEVNGRRTDHPIDPLFLERWSPRAFTVEAISRDAFMTILEAARWAPSSLQFAAVAIAVRVCATRRIGSTL